MLPLLLACVPSPAPKPDVDDTADTSSTDASPCAPDHTLLDLAPQVVDAQYVPDWSYSAWQLNLWLQANGLSWVTADYDVSTWRVRYTSQDRGETVEATALVTVPVLSADEQRGTVLWLHGTSGFEDACAPSIGAVENLAPAIISAGRGYVAVAPDYLGLMAIGDPAPDPHPWIVAEPSGIVAVDALRAVDAWLPTTSLAARIDRNRIVYWGWSEGGFTALQADRRAPSYAPEYAAAGVISAVPPVDILGEVRVGAETFQDATKASALILYLGAQWYGFGDRLAEVLSPDVLAGIPDELDDSCASWPSVSNATTQSELYTDAFLTAVTAGDDMDPWTCMLTRSSLPSADVPYASSAPVLLITGTADTLVPAAPVEAAIPALCDEGYQIEHISCDGRGHDDAPVYTLQDQVLWLDARMDGEAVTPGCGVTTPVACD